MVPHPFDCAHGRLFEKRKGWGCLSLGAVQERAGQPPPRLVLRVIYFRNHHFLNLLLNCLKVILVLLDLCKFRCNLRVFHHVRDSRLGRIAPDAIFNDSVQFLFCIGSLRNPRNTAIPADRGVHCHLELESLDVISIAC